MDNRISNISDFVLDLIEDLGFELINVDGDWFAYETLRKPYEDHPYFEFRGFLINFNLSQQQSPVIKGQLIKTIKDKKMYTFEFSNNTKWFLRRS